MPELTKNEKSMLLYLETVAVDHGGKLQSIRMNADDFKIAEAWNTSGFVQFGRIARQDIKQVSGEPPRTHWCVLSDAAWVAAHAERRARCERLMAKLTIQRNGLETAAVAA